MIVRHLVFFLLFAVFSVSAVSCSGKKSDEILVLTGSSTVAPVVAEVAVRFEKAHPRCRVEVQTGGSSRGIADALYDRATFGMISRELKPGEEALTAHRIAIDGVGVIVHRDNTVSAFTREDLISIYTGKISNWKSLGGKDAKITVVNKADGRATLEVFLDYTGLDSADVVAGVVVGENQQAIKTVVADPNAIAYISIGTAANEAAAGTPVKLASCDGVEPTHGNVAAGRFPMVRPLQLVARGELGAWAREFLDFLTAPANRDLIESHLYVPLAE